MDVERADTFDYVVVGAGSAGCVLADRLTEDGSATVLLLEAGGPARSLAVAVPGLIQKLPSQLNWLYPTEPDPSRGGVADPYSAGRGLGGSSLVNAMMWVRGNPADFDGWSESAPGWDYASVLPYFRRSERFEHGGSPWRGPAGPVRVGRTRVDHPMTTHFLRAAQEVGFPLVADYNADCHEGASLSQVNQRRGLRHSMRDAYLRRARRRPNLVVRTGAAVERVIVHGGRAVGVEYRLTGGARPASAAAAPGTRAAPLQAVTARRETVVCAGAIGSPKLLLLSGIGPAADLAALGIDLVADHPAVGTGLQEHPGTSLVFEVNGRTLNQDVTPLRLLRHGLDFVVRGRGAITATANQAVAFGRSRPESSLPDTELVFMAFGLAPADQAAATSSRLARATARSGGREGERRQASSEPLVTVTAVLLHPVGRGQVTLRSADPGELPVIRQELLGDEGDVAGLTLAARRAREVFAAPSLARHVVRERSPGPAVGTDEEWAAHLRGATFRMFHQAGTCRMGTDDGAVVDEQLRVRGVAGLRVVDASVMPIITSGNTHAPTVMVAERAADLIRALPVPSS